MVLSKHDDTFCLCPQESATRHTANILNMFTSFITTAPTYVCLFWAILLLMDYRNNSSNGKRILFWYMLTCSVLYFAHYCYFGHYLQLLAVTDCLYSFANLAVFPLFYIYVRKITTNRLSAKGVVLHLFPALVISLSNILLHCGLTREEQQQFFLCYMYNQGNCTSTTYQLLSFTHFAARVIFPIQVIVYLTSSLKSIRQFNRNVANHYSDIEQRNMSFLNLLLWLTIFASIGAMVASLLSRTFFSQNMLLLAVPSFLFSCVLFLIGYDGYRRSFSADVFEQELSGNALDEGAGEAMEAEDIAMTQEAASQLAERLLQLLKEEKLYLRPDLKISDITLKLQTNRNYLYYAINDSLHTSFAELVNSMRIEQAQEILKNHPQCNLYDLMTQSGYTSESTFFRNFKKITGKTPKQWAEDS